MTPYEPGELLQWLAAETAPRISKLVIVISCDASVLYLCADGDYAGRTQTVSHFTVMAYYERVSTAGGAK